MEKGLANHSNPESCAGHGNMTGEALTRGTRRPAIEEWHDGRAGRHGHRHHQIHLGLRQPHDEPDALRDVLGLRNGSTAADIDISYTYDAFDRQVDESGTEGDASFDQRTIWDGGNPLGTLDGGDNVTQRFWTARPSIRCWRWRRSAATIRA